MIPVYGTYWVFAMNLALCGTLNQIVVFAGSDRRAPSALGVIVNVLILADGLLYSQQRLHVRGSLLAESPWLGVGLLLVEHLLLLVYMLQYDAVREEVARLAATPERLPVPQLARLQRRRSRAPVPR